MTETKNADVQEMKSLERNMAAMEHAMKFTARQIQVAVQDLELIGTEQITHKEKNAALWLVRRRLSKLAERLLDPPGDEIPF